jgi:hypothetical protein
MSIISPVRLAREHSSTCLTYEDVARLHAAYHFARAIGRPLNWMLSLQPALTYTQLDPREQWFRARDMGSKWLARRDHPLTGLYVWEAPHDVPHLHALIHLPPEHAHDFIVHFNERCVEALEGGAEWRSVYSDGCLPYLCKGIDAKDTRSRQDFGIKPKADGRGLVPWKRCGVTQDIGAAARRQHLTTAIDFRTAA